MKTWFIVQDRCLFHQRVCTDTYLLYSTSWLHFEGSQSLYSSTIHFYYKHVGHWRFSMLACFHTSTGNAYTYWKVAEVSQVGESFLPLSVSEAILLCKMIWWSVGLWLETTVHSFVLFHTHDGIFAMLIQGSNSAYWPTWAAYMQKYILLEKMTWHYETLVQIIKI